MPKKGKRTKGRSHKWSSANIMNLVAGAIVALSMVLGSIFVFGGAPTPSSSSAQNQPTVVATQTTVPSVGSAATPTVVITPTPTK